MVSVEPLSERTRSTRLLPAWLRALRPHQWAKSALLLVPAISGHRLLSLEVLGPLAIAVASFSFAASSVYVVNDLRDLEADRAHARKGSRPLASGELGASAALGLAAAALAISVGLATLLPPRFLLAIGAYVVLASLYSFVLKRLLLIDVLALAVLFTLRVIAGGLATEVVPSSWLLVFAVFFSTGLAFAKRYAELSAAKGSSEPLGGRAYRPNDLDMVRTVGVSSGMLAVLVFALYAQSSDTRGLYSEPELLVLACPVLLYWFGRIWFIAGRGELDEDPVVFALKDPVSWAAGFSTLALVLLARTGPLA
ncbi:MAG: UbiA family prenyltransferase [Deltaproteobacteria bacterium]|nr:UbiA family prenyltransferase [Deltaproteobacteria bacterium]